MGKAQTRKRREAARPSASVSSSAGSGELRPKRLIWIVLCLLVLAGYWQTAGFQFTRFDDDVYITHNDRVKEGLTLRSVVWAFTTGHACNWHPLTWLSHQADWELFGANPAGHHLENVLLHAINAILLFTLLSGITGAVWRSAFVAALFAVHPLHVESVAWVVERKDVLSTLFWMLTMIAYVRYVRGRDGDQPLRGAFAAYVLVAALYALGLMAKPMLVTLPIILMLLDWWPLGRYASHFPSPQPSPARGEGEGKGGSPQSPPKRRERGRMLPLLSDSQTPGSTTLDSPLSAFREKLPLFALAAASCVVTFLVQRAGGAVKALEVYPIGVRIANALVAYVGYLVKTVWPSGLAGFYPHPGTGLPVWQVVGSIAFLMTVTALAVLASRNRPYLAVGWLWYVVTLIPVIGFVQVGNQAMADRYTYIPLIGVFIILAWGIPDLAHALWRTDDASRERALVVAAMVVVAALTVCTFVQARYWRDTTTLFTRALDVTSNNALAHNNLGRALYDSGRKQDALRHYKEAVRIEPGYSDAHYNLGVYYGDRGDYARAAQEYLAALKFSPTHALSHNNLGTILARRGKLDEAIAHYRRALRIDPGYIDARFNLALVLLERGTWNESRGEFARLLSLRPDHWLGHYEFAVALSDRGCFDEAIAHYRHSLRLNPNYATGHYNLGVSLHKRGRVNEAAVEYEEALRLDPRIAPAHNNLGLICEGRGNLDEAIEHYRQALRIDGGFAAARENLARVTAKRKADREPIGPGVAEPA
jgi:tetratricopeptide (TPR) repeat protein